MSKHKTPLEAKKFMMEQDVLLQKLRSEAAKESKISAHKALDEGVKLREISKKEKD